MDDQNPVVNPTPGQDDQQAPAAPAPAADPNAPVAPAPAGDDSGAPAGDGGVAPAPVTPPAEEAGSGSGDVAV